MLNRPRLSGLRNEVSDLEMLHQHLLLREDHSTLRALEDTGSELFTALLEVLEQQLLLLKNHLTGALIDHSRESNVSKTKITQTETTCNKNSNMWMFNNFIFVLQKKDSAIVENKDTVGVKLTGETHYCRHVCF